jgi:hypothetical protein
MMETTRTNSLYDPSVSEKEQKWFDAFRRYIIPLAGVGEAIASRGASPGTTAFNAEKIFQTQEDRKRAILAEEERRKEAAIERALKEKKDVRDEQLWSEQMLNTRQTRDITSGQQERLNEYRKAIEEGRSPRVGTEGPIPPLSDEEAKKMTEGFVQKESPKDYLDYLYKLSQPDFWTKLNAAQSIKENSPSEKFGSLDEKIRKDPVVLKQSQVFSAAEDLRKLLSSNNPIGAEAFGTKMAKLSGEVGNLAIQEQMQYKGSQAAWSQFKQALQKLKSGTLTEENKGYALELVNMYASTASNVRNERLNAIMKSHSYEKGVPLKELYPIATAYGWYPSNNEDSEPSPSGTDKFVVGKIYTDAKNNSAKYLGNGQWKEVPK